MNWESSLFLLDGVEYAVQSSGAKGGRCDDDEHIGVYVGLIQALSTLVGYVSAGRLDLHSSGQWAPIFTESGVMANKSVGS
jgi:hypothetical protein